MNISDQDIEGFFHPGKVATSVFRNSQTLDLRGLLGRMQSSSYTPKINTSAHETLMKAAGSLFHRYEKKGVITFEYDTRLYLGRL